MRSAYSTLMQSKFFNPAFNAAIFDGPIRIYFAQFHEAFALKIYFYFQQKMPTEIAQAKEAAKKSGKNVLIMVYPSVDSFRLGFENHNLEHGPLAIDQHLEDTVIGLRGPLEDQQMDLLLEAVLDSVRAWEVSRPQETSLPSLSL